jgi:hypothetical protein
MLYLSVLASALLAGVASAQAPTTNFSQSEINSLTTPGGTGSETAGTLQSWCIAQVGTCTTLCNGQTNENSCNASSLSYACTCSSNNSAPALAYYANTIPSFECPALRGNCYASNANNLAGQQQCNVTYTCSSINASASGVLPASTSASASATGSATGSASGSTSTSTNAAAAVMHVGEQYGVGILSAGLLAILGLVI